jgi:prepilin-type N-terminal cleavage/methylation domain-containing protein
MNMKKNGFTLLELLITIGIVMITAAFLVAYIDPVGQFQKSNDAKRKSDLAQIQKALEQYYQDKGVYPQSISNQIKDFQSGLPIIWGSSWVPYMNILPADPSSSRSYVYYASCVSLVNCQSYWLYASLEKAKDPQACNNGSACSSLSSNGVAPTACGGTCNFGVSSPNVTP